MNLDLPKILYIFSGVILFIASICPLIRTEKWFIRFFDFPRLQVSILVIFYLIATFFALPNDYPKFIIAAFFIIALGFDAYRIGPYLSIYPTESNISEKEGSPDIKIMSSNVYINNNEHDNLLELVDKVKPDILLMLETDEKWVDKTQRLKEEYQFHKLIPRDNTYGMILYSKYELLDTRVKYLIDDDVPSIFTFVKLKDGTMMELICIHPRPPRPSEASSLQRDGELMAVAKYIKERPDQPIIVVGDLNDVAWSHTTRLFRTVSGTLDPRIGR